MGDGAFQRRSRELDSEILERSRSEWATNSLPPIPQPWFVEAEGFACDSLKRCALGMSAIEVPAYIVVQSSCQLFFEML